MLGKIFYYLPFDFSCRVFLTFQVKWHSCLHPPIKERKKVLFYHLYPRCLRAGFMLLLAVCYHSCEPVNMHCTLHPWYISLTFSFHYAQGCILHHPFLPHRRKHCLSSIKGKRIMSAQHMAVVCRAKGWLIVCAKSAASYMCHSISTVEQLCVCTVSSVLVFYSELLSFRSVAWRNLI